MHKGLQDGFITMLEADKDDVLFFFYVYGVIKVCLVFKLLNFSFRPSNGEI